MCIIQYAPSKTQADGPWWRNPDGEPTEDHLEADSADEEQSVENNGLDDDDGEPDEAEVPKLRPQTKQELSALRGRFENTMHLVAHLYHDLTLRDDMRMVYYAAFHFKREYFQMLQQQKSQDLTN